MAEVDTPEDTELEEAPRTRAKHREAPSGDAGGKTGEKPRCEDSEQDEDGNGKPGKKKGSRLPLIILAIVVVLAAIGGAIWWYLTRNQITTDDAFTNGRVVMIAAQVNGYVTDLAVTDNQFVHKGDLLVQIDPRSYTAIRDEARGKLETAQAQLENAKLALEKAKTTYPAQLAEAEGQLTQVQGQLANAQADYKRQHSVARAATTQTNVDQSTASLRAAEGQVKAAQAQVEVAKLIPQNIAQTAAQVKQLEGQVVQAQASLDQANVNLSFARIVAPQDGWVTKRSVERGDYLQPGAQIMAVVTPEVWVTANFKETQLDRMQPGQKVDIAVDAYPSLHLTGHVDSIQHGSGSKFSAFPAENATGNYVKIVQRVPVKIDIDSGLDPKRGLPLGLSVEPTVYLK